MELLLGAMVWALILAKVWAAARTDHELAKQGKISPRLEAKYGSAANARAKVDKYGFFDFLRDAWNDYWPRRTEALIAARDAKAANPGQPVRLRDRITAAARVVAGAARRVADAPIVRRVLDPIEPRPAADMPPPEPEPPLAVDLDDVDEGTRRFTDTGEEEFFNGEWRPVPAAPDTFTAPPPEPAIEPLNPTAGGTVTAPTGEAVNYETTVAELEALAREQRLHLDACIAAHAALVAAKGYIGDMQDSYRASSAAAASTHEHLESLHLDGVTLAHTGTTADAMPAGAVDTYFDQLEAMEAMAEQRRDAAEAALQATEAALANIQAKYGDAATTVAGDLSGDSRFLDGGGSSGGGPISAASATPGALERDLRLNGAINRS